MIETTVMLHFLGGLSDCKIINTQRQLPSESRYVFTAEGYDVYDHGEYFSVVPQNNKGGSHD